MFLSSLVSVCVCTVIWHTNTNVIVMVRFCVVSLVNFSCFPSFANWFTEFSTFLPIFSGSRKLFWRIFNSRSLFTRILFRKFRIFCSGLFTHNFYNFIHYYTPLQVTMIQHSLNLKNNVCYASTSLFALYDIQRENIARILCASPHTHTCTKGTTTTKKLVVHIHKFTSYCCIYLDV